MTRKYAVFPWINPQYFNFWLLHVGRSTGWGMDEVWVSVRKTGVRLRTTFLSSFTAWPSWMAMSSFRWLCQWICQLRNIYYYFVVPKKLFIIILWPPRTSLSRMNCDVFFKIFIHCVKLQCMQCSSSFEKVILCILTFWIKSALLAIIASVHWNTHSHFSFSHCLYLT